MEELIGNLLIGIGAFVVGLFVTSLIVETIVLVSVTIGAIRNLLQNRMELKRKGVMSAIVTNIIREAGEDRVIVSLNAYDAKNNKVGEFKVAGSTVHVKVLDRIAVA